MSRSGWSGGSYKLRSLIESFVHHYKSNLGSGNISQQDAALAKQHGYAMNQGLRLISSNMQGIWRKHIDDTDISKDEREKINSPAAAGSGSGSGPPKFNFPMWARCILGCVLSFFLPFWKEKWTKFKRIEGEAEMVVEEVEQVAEVVEKVASAAEKVSAQVAESLPDNSHLKKVAMAVEHVSELTAQDAHATTQFIHQVEAIKHDVDGLESLVEPIVNKIVKQGGNKK